MKVKQILFGVLMVCSYMGLNQPLKAQTCEEKNCGCEVNPAPAGTMISHLHQKKQWMVSYRYMRMEMKGMRNGTGTISDPEIFSNYLMSDLEMQMDMHMLMAMYGLTPKLTLMAMADCSVKAMRMGMLPQNETGNTTHDHGIDSDMTMKTNGLGDLKLSLLYGLHETQRHSILLNLGISVPTGSVQKKDNKTGMYAGGSLPYCMQLGSGTWDILPGITYMYRKDAFTASAQITAALPLGYNSNSYKLGNQYTLNNWMAWQWTPKFSTSLRMEAMATGSVRGKIPGLDANMEPSADPKNYGGYNLNAFAGLNYYLAAGFFKNQKLGLEFGLPIYQNSYGIQMNNKYGLFGSWSIQF